jgi:hypothetical protein
MRTTPRSTTLRRGSPPAVPGMAVEQPFRHTNAMVPPHDWQDCRPVLIGTWTEQTEAEQAETARMGAAVDQVWATLSDPERKAFHDFCCHHARDLHARQVMAKIQTLVEHAMQTN